MLIKDLLERQNKNNKTAIKHDSKEIAYSEWYNNSIEISNSINRLFSKLGGMVRIAV